MGNAALCIASVQNVTRVRLHSRHNRSARLSACRERLSEKVLNKRYAINQTALNQPSLTSVALLPLLQEAAEIDQLLGTLGRRTVADDCASLGQSVVKKPAFKKYGSLVRRRGEGLIMSRKITAIQEFLLVLTELTYKKITAHTLELFTLSRISSQLIYLTLFITHLCNIYASLTLLVSLPLHC